jgi:hypothetical protein
MSFEMIKKLLNVGGQKMPDETPELKQYEPIYSGPPEKPEYYILHYKKGKRFPHSKPGMRRIQDEPRHQALSRLRKEYYLATHPDCKMTVDELGDCGGLSGMPLLQEHVPTYDVYRSDKYSVMTWPVAGVYSGGGLFYVVSQDWKEIIEALAPGECQFFPYEYRSRDGSVFFKRYIMNPLQPLQKNSIEPFSPMKSGFRYEFTGRRYAWDKGLSDLLSDGKTYRYNRSVYGGQLVVCRAELLGRNFYYNLSTKCIVSASLYEALKDHCGDYTAFYPLHIDEEC